MNNKELIEKLNENSVTPSYSKEGDAGLDIIAISKTIVKNIEGNPFKATIEVIEKKYLL